MKPPARTCARSGDYPSVSRWAQAAQSQAGRVLGQETTHPFHGGHRRHDDAYIGAIGDLRSNCVLGQETGTITGDGCARSGDYPPISWWAQAA